MFPVISTFYSTVTLTFVPFGPGNGSPIATNVVVVLVVIKFFILSGSVISQLIVMKLFTHINDNILYQATAAKDGVIGCKLKQKANEGCNSCASLAGLVLSFIACFISLVIAPLTYKPTTELTNEQTRPIAI